MLMFAKFVMRDSGLPIHINTPHVTQVRLTLDGEPAIYLVGKETPIVVEGSLEAALKKLEAAGAGFRLVESEIPTPVPATITALPMAASPSPVAPPGPAASLSPVSVEKTAPKRASVGKAKPTPRKAPPKPEVVVQPATPAVAKKPAKPPSAPPPAEQPSGAMSWFKGLR